MNRRNAILGMVGAAGVLLCASLPKRLMAAQPFDMLYITTYGTVEFHVFDEAGERHGMAYFLGDQDPVTEVVRLSSKARAHFEGIGNICGSASLSEARYDLCHQANGCFHPALTSYGFVNRDRTLRSMWDRKRAEARYRQILQYIP